MLHGLTLSLSQLQMSAAKETDVQDSVAYAWKLADAVMQAMAAGVVYDEVVLSILNEATFLMTFAGWPVSKTIEHDGKECIRCCIAVANLRDFSDAYKEAFMASRKNHTGGDTKTSIHDKKRTDDDAPNRDKKYVAAEPGHVCTAWCIEREDGAINHLNKRK